MEPEQFFNPTDATAQPLTKQQTSDAVSQLVIDTTKFPQINRKLVDPIKNGDPRFALFSFIPTAGATPDKDGVFGVAKIRGAFYTSKEADARAEEIISNVDSTNSIFTCFIGVPFALVPRGKAIDTTEIDLKNKTEKTISENIRIKRNAEKKEMEEIEERRADLLADVSKEPTDEDTYIEQRVKLAHLRYLIIEHKAKLKECEEAELKVRDKLREMPKDFEETYMDRYKEGRRKANIPEETDLSGFMKYMTEPIDP
jgi:hypothetical protein